ncbi:TraB/GumN family protein [Brevundimonas guildfordensis]|uniref:TraB/GumN family protein n=1 Tax=Brevundimonas guildfordensis TaxID=2762241 RepID=A0ABR8R1G1_9CAUL|nr:TraB/GumN family protein [Brevundimonas guildfordensis]MBD7941563.1 TraB/GumN family protein [Brevundimonas guildfordensis]
MIRRLLSRTAVSVAALAAVLLAPTTPAFAQASPAADPDAVVAAPAGSGPRLWVVKDEDSTLYLFGTVHVLKPETPWGSARLDRAFASADEYWFEIADLNDMAAAVPLIQAKGVSPDRPLSSLLTAEELADLDAAARTIGATAAQLDQLRPWFAALQLAMASITKAGYLPQNGGDQVLHARAAATGKAIKGFETMPQQIGFIADMSEEAQLAMLRSGLKEFDQAPEFLGRMVSAWASGDVDGLDALIGQEMKAQSPEMYDVMLTRRNADWTNQIVTLLEGSGTAFISVGAGHLAGADSVQAMLAKRGVAVEEVRD